MRPPDDALCEERSFPSGPLWRGWFQRSGDRHMKRRQFNIGLTLVTAVPSALAQQPTKVSHIAFVTPGTKVSDMVPAGNRTEPFLRS